MEVPSDGNLGIYDVNVYAADAASEEGKRRRLARAVVWDPGKIKFQSKCLKSADTSDNFKVSTLARMFLFRYFFPCNSYR